jgi:nitrous oxidase accessory protein NosD
VATIVVSQAGNGDYKTISEAIKRATAGSNIYVKSGYYKENLIIDKALNIKGDGPLEDIIVESQDVSCLKMETEQAVVCGLSLQSKRSKKRSKFFTVEIPQGELILAGCDITAHSTSAVAIYGRKTKPIIRDCQIYDADPTGILIWKSAQPTIENCHIFRHSISNIEIKQDANPIIRDCQIYDGQQSGIYVHRRGQGLIEECDIYANLAAGVEIRRLGNPMVRDCKIRDGKQYGLFVCQKGSGTIERCKIYNNIVGVTIILEGNPLVRHCQINNNRYQAIRVYMNGAGRIEHCDLTGNRRGSWRIESGLLELSRVKSQGNIEDTMASW